MIHRHTISPRELPKNKTVGTERRWQAARDCLPNIHAMQAAWDAENAIHPMPTARPSWAGLIGGALLIVLVFTLIGGLWIVAGATS